MEEIQQKLAALDRKSEELVQDGKYLESLDVMEEALTIRRNVFGETSDEYYKTSEKLCELCNMLSMIFLQKEKFDASLEFLKKAEILAQNSIELRAVTYNNMACYYRRIGKLKVALKCLEDALALEVKLDKTKTLADTHLNICAVYSQLGKHDIAMTHIMKSIILLQDELLATSTPAFDENPKHPSQSDANTKKQFEDRVAVLAIAYHNLGVEHEYLKQYEEAILTYKKAVNFARANLGEESHVCKNLQNVLETAYAQIQETKSKSKQKTFQKPTFGTQMSGTNRFKQASSVYGKEGGGSASKSDAKRISHTGMDPAYKTESQHVVDTYAKPISGDLVSASSGFTPLDRPAPGSNQKKFLNDFHNDESDVGPGERKTIEESMGEYSNQLSGSEMR